MSLSTETPGHEDAPVLRLDLEQSREAPAFARAAIAEFSEDRDMDTTTLATITLLVSEIVTNAVIHPHVESATKIRLYAHIAGGVMRVEVTDEGSGFTPRPRDPAQVGGGYGLYLLEQQATRWGVDLERATTVWFEMTIQAG
jgi:anti-sigma regulatory factor (Ser/Thr protein kinase)